MSDYTPIDCGIHDHLELTAMRGVPVTVEFVTEGGARQTVRAARLDTIRVADGAEFAVFLLEDGERLDVRLDRLSTVGIPGGRLEIRGACTVGESTEG